MQVRVDTSDRLVLTALLEGEPLTRPRRGPAQKEDPGGPGWTPVTPWSCPPPSGASRSPAPNSLTVPDCPSPRCPRRYADSNKPPWSVRPACGGGGPAGCPPTTP